MLAEVRVKEQRYIRRAGRAVPACLVGSAAELMDAHRFGGNVLQLHAQTVDPLVLSDFDGNTILGARVLGAAPPARQLRNEDGVDLPRSGESITFLRSTRSFFAHDAVSLTTATTLCPVRLANTGRSRSWCSPD